MERIHDDEDDEEDDEDDEEREIIDLRLQVYDFDARRARKEKLERARRLPKSVDVSDEKVEGDVDGIELVLSETIIPAIPVLFEEDLVTGKNMPFIKVEKETRSVNPLIDGQRILELIVSRHGVIGQRVVLTDSRGGCRASSTTFQTGRSRKRRTRTTTRMRKARSRSWSFRGRDGEQRGVVGKFLILCS